MAARSLDGDSLLPREGQGGGQEVRAEEMVLWAAASDVGRRGPVGEWTPDGRLHVEAVSVSGRAVGIVFRLAGDGVWVGRAESAASAFFDRDEFRRWLSAGLAGFPVDVLGRDEARLGVTASSRVAVALDEGGLGQAAVGFWELSPKECQALLDAV